MKKTGTCTTERPAPNSVPDRTQNARINRVNNGVKIHIQPQEMTVKVIPGQIKEIDFTASVSLIIKSSGCSPSWKISSF